jgi:hypothetical protein
MNDEAVIQQATREISRQFDNEEQRREYLAIICEQYPYIGPQQVWEALPILLYRGTIDQAQLCHMKYRDFLKTPYWKAVSFQVKSLRPYCSQCGEHWEQLHVHHKHYRRRGLEWKNLDDLTVLCHSCHLSRHPWHCRKVLPVL